MEKQNLDKRELDKWELIDMCDSFKKFQYDIFNRDTGQVVLKQKCKNIREILPDKIDGIHKFDEEDWIDVNIYKNIKEGDIINSGTLIRVLLHKVNIRLEA